MHQDSTLSQQELAITGLLKARLNREETFQAEDRESLAYRVAEIMVASKSLYTEVLPRLLEPPAEGGYSAFEDLSGLRMTLLHLKDLIDDFEEAFMGSMASQREEEGVEPPDWLQET